MLLGNLIICVAHSMFLLDSTALRKGSIRASIFVLFKCICKCISIKNE